MSKKKKTGKFSRFCFKILKGVVKFVYPKIDITGLENLPDEPCVIVGNHCQLNGPIIAEICFPGKNQTWCAGQMMELKEVPDYAYVDFWRLKPKYIKWFFRIVSYLIAPLSVCVFNNAHTIAVYHDSRVLSTFRNTISELKEGNNIIIFPECEQTYNNIVNQFQDKFVDVAKYYYKKTGTELSFVPMYIAPKLKKVCLGKPVKYDTQNNSKEELIRISDILMNEITNIAVSLPEHTVIPYNNIKKKDYKKNK